MVVPDEGVAFGSDTVALVFKALFVAELEPFVFEQFLQEVGEGVIDVSFNIKSEQ